jgi:DNA-binding transcriptional MocR family regulator
MNVPPQPREANLVGSLARAFAALRAETSFESYLSYQQPGGTRTQRGAAAEWLQFLVPGVTGERLVVAPGTQSALFCLLLTLTSPGEAVFTEALTYPGFKAAAAARGVTLIGIAMDGDGLDPAALERACRRHDKVRVIYLMPTMHNPATATMPPKRRAQVAQIIARRGLTLIEDDPYAFLTTGITPLAALIPERTWLTASLSKSVTPGLRAAFAIAPRADGALALIDGLRATLQMPAPLATAIALRWVADGTADAIIKAVRVEAAARQNMAREALADSTYAAHPHGLHVWLSLPGGWSSARFAAHLQSRGLGVVTADAFATSDPPPHAIRVALGAAPNRPTLLRALRILSETLSATDQAGPVV